MFGRFRLSTGRILAEPVPRAFRKPTVHIPIIEIGSDKSSAGLPVPPQVLIIAHVTVSGLLANAANDEMWQRSCSCGFMFSDRKDYFGISIDY